MSRRAPVERADFVLVAIDECGVGRNLHHVPPTAVAHHRCAVPGRRLVYGKGVERAEYDLTEENRMTGALKQFRVHEFHVVVHQRIGVGVVAGSRQIGWVICHVKGIEHDEVIAGILAHELCHLGDALFTRRTRSQQVNVPIDLRFGQRASQGGVPEEECKVCHRWNSICEQFFHVRPFDGADRVNRIDLAEVDGGFEQRFRGSFGRKFPAPGIVICA